MEWTAEHDVTLGREISLVNPFKNRKRSVERGTAWKQIASNLNASSNMKFAVSQGSVRVHLLLPQKKYRKKMRQEEHASGISPEKTELDKLIEEINDIDETAAAEHEEGGRIKQDKGDQNKTKADTCGERQWKHWGKRRSDKPKRKKKTRIKGGGGVAVILLGI